MAFASCGFLLRGWTSVNPAVAVIAHVHVVMNVHMFVVDVMEPAADVPDVRVVKEMAALPASAVETGAEPTEAVINAAIETYCGTPEASVPNEAGAAPSPPSRSPEETDFGRFDPRAGNPKIIACVVIVVPISRRPKIAVTGTNRLVVNQYRGWCNSNGDTDAHLCVQRFRHSHH